MDMISLPSDIILVILNCIRLFPLNSSLNSHPESPKKYKLIVPFYLCQLMGVSVHYYKEFKRNIYWRELVMTLPSDTLSSRPTLSMRTCFHNYIDGYIVELIVILRAEITIIDIGIQDNTLNIERITEMLNDVNENNSPPIDYIPLVYRDGDNKRRDMLIDINGGKQRRNNHLNECLSAERFTLGINTSEVRDRDESIIRKLSIINDIRLRTRPPAAFQPSPLPGYPACPAS